MDESLAASTANQETQAVGGKDGIARRLVDLALDLGLDFVEFLQARLRYLAYLCLFARLLILRQGATGHKRQ